MDSIYGVYIFDGMEAKRRIRTYKIKDEDYEVAQAKAAKTKKPLATRIEEFVVKYAGVERSSYFAAMGDDLMKVSNKKKK